MGHLGMMGSHGIPGIGCRAGNEEAGISQPEFQRFYGSGITFPTAKKEKKRKVGLKIPELPGSSLEFQDLLPEAVPTWRSFSFPDGRA